MIYLITGTPGTGKTAMVVDMMLSDYEGLFTETLDGQKVARPLYFCHIDGLDERKFKAHRLTEEQLQSAPLDELVPTGSVIVVDEADYTYPTRSAAREVPPYVKKLKELRHEGFTLILMTQHPQMLDSYLRKLIGKHIHLERKQLGTKRYEWFGVKETLSAADLATATPSWYKPPARAFKYYKSATKHVKFSKKRHIVFYVLPVLLLFVAYMAYSVIGRFATYADPQSAAEVAETAEVVQEQHQPARSGMAARREASAPAERPPLGSVAADYRPSISHMPETKPLYDGLRQVRQMEYPVACVDGGSSCHCYSHQATVIPMPEAVCRLYVAEGLPFNPYKEPQPQMAAGLQPAPSAGGYGAEVLVMGGEAKPNLAYSADAPRSAQ